MSEVTGTHKEIVEKYVLSAGDKTAELSLTDSSVLFKLLEQLGIAHRAGLRPAPQGKPSTIWKASKTVTFTFEEKEI